MHQAAHHRAPRVIHLVRIGTDERVEQALALGQLLREARPQPPVEHFGRNIPPGSVMRNIEAIDAWQLKSDEGSEVGRLTETLPAHITCEQNLRIAQALAALIYTLAVIVGIYWMVKIGQLHG